jgi:hypothetical protein
MPKSTKSRCRRLFMTTRSAEGSLFVKNNGVSVCGQSTSNFRVSSPPVKALVSIFL